MLKKVSTSAAIAATTLATIAVGPGAATAAAVPSGGSLSASSSRALAGAAVKLSGKLPPRGQRGVTLQRYASGSWHRVASKRSNSLGKFAFTATMPTKAGLSKYRVYAPRARVAGHIARAIVTPTKAVTVVNPTVPTTPPPPAAPAPGTRSNPYGVGTSFGLGEWNFRLGTTDTDAWPEISAENQFNDAPLPGWSYITVPVTFTYVGTSSGKPWLNTTVKFLGSDNVIYDGYSQQSCGVLPNDSDDIQELYSGGSATGNECAAVPSSAIEGGRWRVQAGYDDGERFVSIR